MVYVKQQWSLKFIDTQDADVKNHCLCTKSSVNSEQWEVNLQNRHIPQLFVIWKQNWNLLREWEFGGNFFLTFQAFSWDRYLSLVVVFLIDVTVA